MSLLENLPLENFRIISSFLEIRDLVNLSQVNRGLRLILRDDSLWLDLAQGFLDTQNVVIECLQDSGLSNFSPEDSFLEDSPFSDLGRNQWAALNLLRVELLSSDNQIDSDSSQKLETARNFLSLFQNNHNLELLYKAASIAYETIIYQPSLSLHLLAFISFALNCFPEANILVSLGLSFDESFEPLLELKSEIDMLSFELGGDVISTLLLKFVSERAIFFVSDLSIVSNYLHIPKIDLDKVPMIVNGNLSIQFKKVIGNIFQQFSTPGTQWMREQDLSRFITVTNNGQAPPLEFVKHVFSTYANPNGFKNRPAMSKEDFENFYLHLTLDDPQETRNDLASHGFDPTSLAPLKSNDEDSVLIMETDYQMSGLAL